MKRIMLVFGTRPEAIKMCPLVNELKTQPSEFEVKVCVTGQHREMLDSVLGIFNVKPDHDLAIMKQNQTLFDITTEVLLSIRGIYEHCKPDIVLVHGDTTTSFAAALAAYYMRIEVGHVEAGLRTYNPYSPFPEEFNRQSVDSISDYLFAPTEISKNHLLREGKSVDRVFVTGNTGIDALSTTVSKEYTHDLFRWLGDSRLILITAHRRENIGQPMRHMFRAIKKVVDENASLKAVYPIHPNPKVREIAHEELDSCNRIKLIEPLDVLDFHNFMARSYVVMTDSGGIQEEAPSLGKPVLVMRDTTERPEGVEAGTLKLVGTQESDIYNALNSLLLNEGEYEAMSKASNPYGDGSASKRIADILRNCPRSNSRSASR